MLITLNKLIEPISYAGQHYKISDLLVNRNTWEISKCVITHNAGTTSGNSLLNPQLIEITKSKDDQPLSISIKKTPGPSKDESSSDDRLLSNIFELSLISDGRKLGHIKEVIIDTASWSVPLIISDSRNWIPLSGRDIIIPTIHLEYIDWISKCVHTKHTNKTIKSSPSVCIRGGTLHNKDSEIITDYYNAVINQN
tara:strand:- start:695 stop:1282 length:588 start_codon:yes stop_codon:yes gene_type:complete